MLAKCANPACSATFHYFHEGKLFAIESKIDSQATGPFSDPEYTGRPRRLRYVWLCSSCCGAMTIQADGDHGVTVVRTRRAQQEVSIMDHRVEMVA